MGLISTKMVNQNKIKQIITDVTNQQANPGIAFRTIIKIINTLD